MPAKPMTPAMTTGQLWTALEARFPKREYAFLAEVRNTTGFARTIRTADALALSLWPSRGIELAGFEIKAHRGDWIREKERPEKADEIARFCDFWWLVVTHPSIAPVEEVPAAWGLLGPDKNAKKLVILKSPRRLKAKPFTKLFVASVLRNASGASVPHAVVQAKIDESHRNGVLLGESRATDTKELERLREVERKVVLFRTASGLDLASIYNRDNAKQIGEAVQALITNSQSISYQRQHLERLASTSEQFAIETRRRATELADISQLFMEPTDGDS